MSRLDDVIDYESKYEEDGVLKNKLGIANQKDLDKAERMLTGYRLTKLYLNSEEQTFDVKHYLSIHKYLFQDIYDFAGEIRSENMNKRIPFCLPQYIYSELTRVLDDAKVQMKQINSRDKLLSFITVLYSDLDIIHPFREGNGRTEREFIRQYIDYICKTNNLEEYYLDYSDIDREEYIDAVVKADALLDYGDLFTLFSSILTVKKNKKRTK